MMLPTRVTTVIGRITDIQTREAVSRFLSGWEKQNRVFTTGALKSAHRHAPPTKVALKLSQIPGADLSSWVLPAATMLEWVIESFAKMYKKTGQLNPSIRNQVDVILKSR